MCLTQIIEISKTSFTKKLYSTSGCFYPECADIIPSFNELVNLFGDDDEFIKYKKASIVTLLSKLDQLYIAI
jgi:hypothetical protein